MIHPGTTVWYLGSMDTGIKSLGTMYFLENRIMKKLLAFITLSFLNITISYGSDNSTLPHTFTPNTIISSGEMNENLQFLLDQIKALKASGSGINQVLENPKYIITGNEEVFMQSKDGVNWSELRSPSSGIEYRNESFLLGNYHFSRRSNPVWYTNDFVNFNAVDSFNISRPNNNNTSENFYFLGEGGDYYYVNQKWGEVYHSNDLINWTHKFSGNDNTSYYNLAYVNGHLISRPQNETNGQPMNIHYANLNDNSNQWIDTGHSDTSARYFSYKNGKYFYASSKSDSGQKCQIFSSDNLLQWTKAIHPQILTLMVEAPGHKDCYCK